MNWLRVAEVMERVLAVEKVEADALSFSAATANRWACGDPLASWLRPCVPSSPVGRGK